MPFTDPIAAQAYRERIDELDRVIVPLLAQRIVVVRALGALKTDEATIRSSDRVAEVLAAVGDIADACGAPRSIVENVYSTLITELTEMQRSGAHPPRTEL